MTFSIDLGGRRALVTGAGQGVGRAIAVQLAAAGANVVVNDVAPDRAEIVVEEIRDLGGRADIATFDVTDWPQVQKAVLALGTIDILINNAGGAKPNDRAAAVPFANSEPEDWRRVIDVNLLGVMHCTRAVLAGMIASGDGRIVTVISDAGRHGEANLSPYSAAKAGAGRILPVDCS